MLLIELPISEYLVLTHSRRRKKKKRTCWGIQKFKLKSLYTYKLSSYTCTVTLAQISVDVVDWTSHFKISRSNSLKEEEEEEEDMLGNSKIQI
jgi:hypothetical protein